MSLCRLYPTSADRDVSGGTPFTLTDRLALSPGKKADQAYGDHQRVNNFVVVVTRQVEHPSNTVFGM